MAPTLALVTTILYSLHRCRLGTNRLEDLGGSKSYKLPVLTWGVLASSV